jgi:O-acetylserine/cysteine efflux transporter
MPIRHRLLAAAVAAIWGLNFIAIHASLQVFPPLLLAALRWVVVAVPTLAFVPWPKVPVRAWLGYGLGFGFLQFVFLYWGMALGMPAGLASLVLQVSAPFTVILGALRGEVPSVRAWCGLGVAAVGMLIVGTQRVDAGNTQALAFGLVVLGGLGWALGNIAARAAKPAVPLHFSSWMAVVPALPFWLLTALVEGPSRIAEALHGALQPTPVAMAALAGLLYTSVVASVVGSGLWTWLMAQHPASTVAPYSLLVPVFGLVSAYIANGERHGLMELGGAALVLTGVLYGSGRPRKV